MTDPEIVRWLAEKVMGWHVHVNEDGWRLSKDNQKSSEPSGRWDPLTDARATEQVMEALMAKEYGYLIRHPAGQCVNYTAVVWGRGHLPQEHWSVDRNPWRAFCLAAVKATGGGCDQSEG